MKKLYFAVLLTGCQFYASAQCADLFFSEYLEGSSNNKALELYNPTDNTIDLSSYSIGIFSNGSPTVSATFNIKGALSSKGSYVMINSQADSALQLLADTLVGGNVLKFNGDDALILFHGTDTLDVIGKVGDLPTSGYWDVDTGGTKDQSLVRKQTVNGGELDWAINAMQWAAYPKDSYSSLGGHSMTPCTTTSISTFTSGYDIEIYPNPAHHYLYVQNVTSNCLYSVYDVLGNKVKCSSFLSSSGFSININHLEKGIYILSLTTNNQQVVKRFVKE